MPKKPSGMSTKATFFIIPVETPACRLPSGRGKGIQGLLEL
jgi:hypothetical protein